MVGFKSFPSTQGIPLLVAGHYDLRLRSTMWTNTICVDYQESRQYECRLYGPYQNEQDEDVRVWVQVRTLEGSTTLSLTVQDATDDAWLNSNAYGLDEKYGKLVYLSPTGRQPLHP